MLTDKTICVVGLGLLGGSFAMGLTDCGHQLYGIDIRQENIDFAVAHGLIRDGTVGDHGKFLSAAKLVILGLYPTQLTSWVKENRRFLKSGTLLTDVCGVKGHIVEEVQELLPEDVEFVPAHPMAGRELSGVQNAYSAIFKGASFIITPTARNSSDGIARVRALAEKLGFARIALMSPDEHDKIIAYISQLPHAAAAALVTSSADESAMQFAGGSFLDITRVADINVKLWTELFIANSENLVLEIERFTAQLERLKKHVQEHDAGALGDMLRASLEKSAALRKQRAQRGQK